MLPSCSLLQINKYRDALMRAVLIHSDGDELANAGVRSLLVETVDSGYNGLGAHGHRI